MAGPAQFTFYSPAQSDPQSTVHARQGIWRGVFLVVVMIVAGLADQAEAQSPKVLEFLNKPAYSQFKALLEGAVEGGFLAYEWINDGDVTRFAPDNTAFAALGPSLVECLKMDRRERSPDDPDEALVSYLSSSANSFYPVAKLPPAPGITIPSRTYLSLSSRNRKAFPKFVNLTIVRDASSGLVTVNGVNVTEPDALVIPENRIVIHGISAFLLPPGFSLDVVRDSCRKLLPALQERPEFSTFVSLLANTSLLSAVQGPVILFAPTNDAFKAFGGATLDCLLNTTNGRSVLSTVLQYHILPGSTVRWDLTFYDDLRREGLTSINKLPIPVETNYTDSASGFTFRIAGEVFEETSYDEFLDGPLFKFDGVLLPEGGTKMITDAGCPAPLVARLVGNNSSNNSSNAAGLMIPASRLTVLFGVVGLMISAIL